MNIFLAKQKYILGGFFIVIALIYIIQLFNIQIINVSYKLSANNNVFRYLTEYPARGLVFDRNGELLVYNEASYDLMVIPQDVGEFDTTDLAKILEIPRRNIVENFERAKKISLYQPYIFYKQLTLKKYSILGEKMFKFPGFFVQRRTTRRYPSKIAAHLLGYIGEVDEKKISQEPYYKSGDYIGISGIERSYEKSLRGEKGLSVLLVDVHNRIKAHYMDGKYDTLPIVGDNIITSLDAKLQDYGERLMQNKYGSIVAIEPSTGEILCFVTSPTYDPNLLVGNVERATNYRILANDPTKPLFNRALMACYPPGSTFKPIQALIGLQEGVITTSSVFPCAGGFFVGNLKVGCHHGGGIDFYSSIAGSCNAYYCYVHQKILDDKKFKSVKLSYNNWREHVNSFGLGKKLGSDLSHELGGILPSSNHFDKFYGKDRWKSLTLISMAIGQGELGFTPLQMANATATIANRGFYYIPHVVKEIQGQLTIDKKFLEKRYTKISPQYFQVVVDAMEMVVTGGTATNARINGIPVCGKTGTAQNPHGEDHSIFIAFAPKDEPKIAIAVYVENAGFGATWAAPIASLMIEKYLKGKVTRTDVEQMIFNANLMNVIPKPKKK